MKYYISKFQNGGWVSPEALPVKVTQNTEGDSGYRGELKYYKSASRTKKEDDEEKRLKDLASNTTSEIDPLTGTPRVIEMSGYDPLLGNALDLFIGGKMLGDTWKGIQYGLGKYGTPALKNWARGRIVGQEMKRMPLEKYALPPTISSSEISNLRLMSPQQGGLKYSDIEEVLDRALKEEIKYRQSPTFIKRAKATGIYKDEEIPKLIEEYKDLASKIKTQVSDDVDAKEFGNLSSMFDINNPKSTATLYYEKLKHGTLGQAFGTATHEIGGHGLSFPFSVSKYGGELSKKEIEAAEKVSEEILKKHYPLIYRAKMFNSDLIKKELRPNMKFDAKELIRKYKYKSTALLQKELPWVPLETWKNRKEHWLDYIDNYINSDNEIMARTHAADRMENLSLLPGRLLTDLKELYPEYAIRNIMKKHLVWGLPTVVGSSSTLSNQNKKSDSN